MSLTLHYHINELTCLNLKSRSIIESALRPVYAATLELEPTGCHFELGHFPRTILSFGQPVIRFALHGSAPPPGRGELIRHTLELVFYMLSRFQ